MRFDEFIKSCNDSCKPWPYVYEEWLAFQKKCTFRKYSGEKK